MGKANKHSMREPDPTGEQWDCLNCGQRMRKWRHSREWAPPKNKGYFRFWYECLTPTCRTRQVMPKQGFVPMGGQPPPGEPGPEAEHSMCAEDLQRLAHFRSI